MRKLYPLLVLSIALALAYLGHGFIAVLIAWVCAYFKWEEL